MATTRKIKDRVCVHCETVYTPSYSGQKYCGSVCGHIARFGAPPGPPLKGRVCEVCGTTFKATYTEQRTCGRVCGVKICTAYDEEHRRRHSERAAEIAALKPPLPPKPSFNHACLFCKKAFTSTRPLHKYCSARCGTYYHFWTRFPGSVGPDGHPERECPKCKALFKPARGNQVFCCKLCCRRYYSDLVPFKNARQRARKYGVVYEPGIKPLEIYERDNWRCALCHKKIAKNKKFPHPLSPSIDHTIPMCEGGGHVRANIRAAHLLCNALKSNKVAGQGEQLLLFG